ncbi:MAG TPA: hypothetical protein ENK57_03320 [Polyangiaceae bacterium]|nr:hypothetical protein [Polyangiaceae bacterium]
MSWIDDAERWASQTLTGARRLELEAGDEHLPDLVAVLRRVETELAERRRGILAELDPNVDRLDGERFTLEVPRRAVRSFNTAAIMTALQTAGVTLLDAVAADAVRLTWRWTPLRRLFRDAGIEMRVAPREVSDLEGPDAPHVGEVWTTGSPRIIAREER